MITSTRLAIVAALAAVSLVAACGGEGETPRETGATMDTALTTDTAADTAADPTELRVAAVMIGKRIGEGNRIAEPTFQFAPTDTVYASVIAQGAPPSATLSARWLFQDGRVIDSSSTTIQPAGEEIVEFHIAEEDGLPVGTYQVQIYADGDSVDVRTFEVRE